MVANTPPPEPAHSVFIGTVARSHPTQWRIVLAIQNGYELWELHGVDTTGESTWDVLQKDTDGIWRPKPNRKAIGEEPTWSINSSNTIFVLVNSPITDSEMIHLNGQRLKKTVDYSLSTNIITLTLAPEPWDILLVDYTY
jgi:hypothetical protein